MFKTNQKTFLQQILSSELSSFHDGNVATNIKTDSSDDFKGGNILFKIPINKKFMDDMLTTYRNPVLNSAAMESASSNFHDARDYDGLFENVTDQIINVPAQKSYSECLDIVMDYKNALKDNFYGAVFKSKSLLLNPFHILTALSVLSDKSYQDKLYDIIIYSYKDRQQLNEFTRNEVSDHALVNKNIDALMNAYVSRIQTETRIIKNDNHYVDRSSESVTVSVQTKKFPDEDPDCSHYLSGHQLLTKGIFAPFYGVSLIKMNGLTKGLRLTPFGSCNISSDGGKPIPNPTPEYGSVCTGSQSNTTLKGLRTLSHAYLGSPFGGGFIQIGALTYADIMIERCISLYESAELMTIGKNIPLEFSTFVEDQPLYSDEELACTTLMEYFKLSRATYSLPNTSAECKDRYNAMKLWISEQDIPSEDSLDTLGQEPETPDQETTAEPDATDYSYLPTYENLPDIHGFSENDMIRIVNTITSESIYQLANEQWELLFYRIN